MVARDHGMPKDKIYLISMREPSPDISATRWHAIEDHLHNGHSAHIYVTRQTCLCSTKEDVAASGAYAELQSGLHPDCSLTTIDTVRHCHCCINH